MTASVSTNTYVRSKQKMKERPLKNEEEKGEASLMWKMLKYSINISGQCLRWNN